MTMVRTVDDGHVDVGGEDNELVIIMLLMILAMEVTLAGWEAGDDKDLEIMRRF